MYYCFATVTRCNGGSNEKCGNRKCIQKEFGVTCSCDIYSDSEELTTLARGTNLLFLSGSVQHALLYKNK